MPVERVAAEPEKVLSQLWSLVEPVINCDEKKTGLGWLGRHIFLYTLDTSRERRRVHTHLSSTNVRE